MNKYLLPNVNYVWVCANWPFLPWVGLPSRGFVLTPSFSRLVFGSLFSRLAFGPSFWRVGASFLGLGLAPSRGGRSPLLPGMSICLLNVSVSTPMLQSTWNFPRDYTWEYASACWSQALQHPAIKFCTCTCSFVGLTPLVVAEVVTAHDGLGGEAFHLYFHIEQLNTIKFLFTCGTSPPGTTNWLRRPSRPPASPTQYPVPTMKTLWTTGPVRCSASNARCASWCSSGTSWRRNSRTRGAVTCRRWGPAKWRRRRRWDRRRRRSSSLLRPLRQGGCIVFSLPPFGATKSNQIKSNLMQWNYISVNEN